MRIMPELKNKFTMEDMIKAYMVCRDNKRRKDSAIEFEIDFEKHLVKLLEDVNNRTYVIGSSDVFVVTHPKAREVWAAQFRDRVVHHLVYNEIMDTIGKTFIEDTFSCIPERGTLAAVKRLEKQIRQASSNYSKDLYYLNFDIKNFFVSIDREKLVDMYKYYLGDNSLVTDLLYYILRHDVTVNPNIKTVDKLHLVPYHKSLFNAPNGFGLPIGNHPSQISSNVYMSPLDRFIKQVLRVRYYNRYVDDGIILSTSKEELENILKEMEMFLKERLGLTIHPDKCTIGNVVNGINYVGYIVKPYRKYIRRSTIHTFLTKTQSKYYLDDFSSFNSYYGIFRNASSYKLRCNIAKKLELEYLMAEDSTHLDIGKVNKPNVKV